MRGLKLAIAFAAGLIGGLMLSLTPSNTVIADGANHRSDDGGGGGGGDSGGIAGSSCIGDVAPSPNGNGIINTEDLLAVIGNWGSCTPPCNPAGTWNNASMIDYTCSSGTFQLHIQNWNFTQTGTALCETAGGIGGTMIGPAVVCQAGNTFSVSLSEQAGCIINYTLTGTFTSSTHFNGTFKVNFCGANCTGCFNQTVNVSATKQ